MVIPSTITNAIAITTPITNPTPTTNSRRSRGVSDHQLAGEAGEAGGVSDPLEPSGPKPTR